MMKRIIATFGLAMAALSLPSGASAQMVAFPNETSRQLAACIERSASAEDKLLTARWLAASIASAKDLQDIVTVDADAKLEADKAMGALFTRLLTQDCRETAKILVRNADQAGLQAAGGRLGELAMAQLMTDPDALAALMAYVNHADMAAVGSLAF